MRDGAGGVFGELGWTQLEVGTVPPSCVALVEQPAGVKNANANVCASERAREQERAGESARARERETTGKNVV